MFVKLLSQTSFLRWSRHAALYRLDLSNGGFKDLLCSVKKFMVVVPSTNTTVEADFWRMIHANKDLDGLHSSSFDF